MAPIFTPLPDKPDHNALELEVLETWEREDTFERLRAANRGGQKFSFVDGPVTDLADDWAVLPAPGPFTPASGVCQEADFTETVALAAYAPVDCAAPHRVETVHVRSFPSARPAPPTGGSTELRGAFAECDTRATGYVGDDWRAGRLRLSLALPSAPAWTAGSRWYRCDLSEVNTVEAGATVVARTGSLRDVLKGQSPLRLGCQRSRGGGTAGSLTTWACPTTRP